MPAGEARVSHTAVATALIAVATSSARPYGTAEFPPIISVLDHAKARSRQGLPCVWTLSYDNPHIYHGLWDNRIPHNSVPYGAAPASCLAVVIL